MSPPPLRVAQPGAIKETCRLCERELELSVENPRRICAHCGEINLPAEHASAPEVPRAVQLQPPPLRPFAAPARTGPVAMNFRQTGQGLFGMFAFGAGSLLVPAAVGFFLAVAESPSGRFNVNAWAQSVVLMGLPASLVSAVVMAWLVAGSRWAGNRPAAVATWVSGWASTAALLFVVGFWLMIKSYGR